MKLKVKTNIAVLSYTKDLLGVLITGYIGRKLTLEEHVTLKSIFDFNSQIQKTLFNRRGKTGNFTFSVKVEWLYYLLQRLTETELNVDDPYHNVFEAQLLQPLIKEFEKI